MSHATGHATAAMPAPNLKGIDGTTLGLYAATVLLWGVSWIGIRAQLGVVAPEMSVLWRFLLAIQNLLIVLVFLMKYGVGVQLAMEPALAHHTGFAFATTAVYGALSGLFAVRSLRVLRLARRPGATLATSI